MISAETNPTEFGQWRTSRAEYERGIMDMISSDKIPQPVRDITGKFLETVDASGRVIPLLVNPRKIVEMKSGRTGFTSILENTIGFHIDQDPCSMMMVQPTVEDGKEWSKDNLAPLIRDTPCLQGKVRESSVKDSGNTILHKIFAGGFVRIIGANSPRGFRRVTIRIVMFDELDGAPPSAGAEGDPLALAERRAATVWNAKIIAGSTPTVRNLSPIEFQYAHSSQGHYYVPCPRCNHFQMLVFSPKSPFATESYRVGDTFIVGSLAKGYLKFDKENCTWAHYVCEECLAEIPENEKQGMVLRGQWRYANPQITNVVGFHINELYSSLNTTWQGLAKDFLIAHQQREHLRVFTNTRLGETFEELDMLTISDHILLSKVEDYENIVPASAYILTCGVDIMDDRAEACVYAWGDGDECWLIEHVIIPGSPHDDLLWEKLDAYLRKEFPHALGTSKVPFSLPIRSTFVDAGHNTTNVYRFTAPREGHGIFSVLGRDGKRPLTKASGRDRKTHALFFILGVDDAKQKIYDRLKKDKPEEWKSGDRIPGYIHLNKNATLSFCQELTAERRIRKWKGANIVWAWDLPPGRPNHVLDQTVYALCALELIRPVWDKWKNNFMKRLEKIREAGESGTPAEAEHKTTLARAPKKKWSSRI